MFSIPIIQRIVKLKYGGACIPRTAEAKDDCLTWELQASLGSARKPWVGKQSLDYTQEKKER